MQKTIDTFQEKYDLPYKHTTWIPRWNDVEKVVFTSFQRGVFVG